MASRIDRVGAAVLALGLGLGLGSGPALSAYPDRPIRLLVSFPPGGSSDAMARIVQSGVEKQLGQSLVIENRPGAGSMIAIDMIAPISGWARRCRTTRARISRR